MPNNLTDVNAFTSPIVVPAGSDDAGLTYLLTAFQALANRTEYLRQRVAVVTERTFVVSPHRAQFDSGWTRGPVAAVSTSNSAVVYLDLDFLPDGAVLKRVRALVTPGANTMSMDLRTRTLDFVTPDKGSNTGIELGITSSGTSLQVITTTALTETIDRLGGKFYSVTLTANSGAGASNDTLWGFQIVADFAGAL